METERFFIAYSCFKFAEKFIIYIFTASKENVFHCVGESAWFRQYFQLSLVS